MLPLAKLWTWTGHLFIPLALGWAIYVRSGLPGDLPAIGIIISRANFGLIATLIAAGVLVWTFALYVQTAKARGATSLVPPNTTFEDEKTRNLIISCGTAAVFSMSVVASLIIFSVRYAESTIYEWNAQSPLENGFWASRWAAFRLGCPSPPCFALGPHMDGLHPINGVVEYILFLTDGAVVVLVSVLIGGVIVLVAAALRSRPEPVCY
jgi:hypothetical protein